MKYTSLLCFCLIGTVISFLIAGAFGVYGTEYDTSGFYWIGVVSGMFTIICAHGAVVTWELYKDAINTEDIEAEEETE